MSDSQAKRQRSKQLLRLWRLCKRISSKLRRPVPAGEKKIIFILGCQRSGTTLLTRIFERDWFARVFGEYSELSSDDSEYGIRLNSLDRVGMELRDQRYPTIVTKPLVESHRGPELLAHFDNGHIVWLYRSFYDVAASDLFKFGERNGIDNIRPIIKRKKGNWRSEFVSNQTRELIEHFFSEDMNPFDAAGLFWYARNSLFFDTNVCSTASAKRVLILPYERLTSEPDLAMRSIYNLIGSKYPGQRLVAEVDPASVGKGKRRLSEISDEVRQHCEHLLQRLDDAAGYARPKQSA